MLKIAKTLLIDYVAKAFLLLWMMTLNFIPHSMKNI